MDTLTQLKVQGITSDEPVLSPTLLHRTPSNLYEDILSDFPSLTIPYNKEQPIKHDVTHQSRRRSTCKFLRSSTAYGMTQNRSPRV